MLARVRSTVIGAAVLLIFALAAAPAEACPPATSVLKSPRNGTKEVQAKALNDRGDVVGFADGRDGMFRAVLWRGGKVSRAVVIGVLPGYVSSEAYAINNDRVVFGLLYDRRERTFPFRWRKGRMTLLRGPGERREQVAVPDRNAINERGEIAGTLTGGGRRRAVRWSRTGKATLLPPLPGHTWTNAWSIAQDGTVSGWSRRLPNEDGENNPVIWSRSGAVTALGTVPGRADGAAEATNRSGLTVGYLGNLGTETDPENDSATAWSSATAAPQFLDRATPQDTYGELVDVNDRGQAAGMSGTFTSTGFPRARPAIWQTGATGLRTLTVPRAARRHRVVSTQLNDINARGDIVGNAFGLSAAAFDKLQRIYPVLWTCPFGR
jgi:hypothetical protein